MTRWQRRARLVIALFAIAFAVVVARQFRPRTPPAATTPVPRADPVAILESTGGRLERFKLSQQNVNVTYDHQMTYADGSAKLLGVTIVADEKDGEGSFTATAKEGLVKKDVSAVVLNGDVRLVSAEIRARTEHATFDKSDNTVRAPGPVTLTEGRTTASGVGMTFDRVRDVLSILDQASVQMTADETGGGTTDITSGNATFDRRARVRRFERNVKMQRGGQTIETDEAVASLNEDGSRIDTVELHGGARITTPKAAAGGLQSLTGRDLTLKYAADGQALEHVIINGDAVIRVAGEAGEAGREIVAAVMDIILAPDGSTPTALIARDNVQLTIPSDAGQPARTIRAATLDGKGEAGRGLTRAVFSGNVQYRERGATVNRAVSAAALDVGLKRGLSSIEDAKFSRGVRFEDGKMLAVAAAGRYDLDKGTLELTGSEPGALVPRVVNEQIAVDAARIDVTLEGPKMKAAASGSDKVKSVMKPAPKGDAEKPAENATKMPSMLKQDQPVNITASALDYDGSTSHAAYTGAAQLWQGDTSIKGETIIIDGKTGDLAATAVTSTTFLEQHDKDKDKDKDGKAKDRVRSVAAAKELKYEDATRRLTYSGDAHMSGPEGEMTAVTIELYLKPSGDELDRAEAYDDVTLREQKRKTTGSRMTYTTADERYVIVGAPVKIVDSCERETTGKTLTFLKATDSIVVDGNQQTRTQTKGGGKCSS
jgi:LPS export ABC transporter protein LptC